MKDYIDNLLSQITSVKTEINKEIKKLNLIYKYIKGEKELTDESESKLKQIENYQKQLSWLEKDEQSLKEVRSECEKDKHVEEVLMKYVKTIDKRYKEEK